MDEEELALIEEGEIKTYSDLSRADRALYDNLVYSIWPAEDDYDEDSYP